MKRSRTITIDALFIRFSRVLALLARECEDAWVPWDDEHAYDEWDRLASAAYKTFVTSFLFYEVPDQHGYEPAPYDLGVAYAEHSFFGFAEDDGYLIVRRLSPGEDGSFATLELVTVGSDLTETSAPLRELPLGVREIECFRRFPSGRVERVREVVISPIG